MKLVAYSLGNAGPTRDDQPCRNHAGTKEKNFEQNTIKKSTSGIKVKLHAPPTTQDEIEICEIVKKETSSDFVFVYGYPTAKKPFYVFPNPENPEFNEGVDLICRGREWLSGGRRINKYDQLIEHVEKWGMDPAKIKMFLEAFKYGAPPEGGFALGAERMVMQMLELANVREATLFPRDM